MIYSVVIHRWQLIWNLLKIIVPVLNKEWEKVSLENTLGLAEACVQNHTHTHTKPVQAKDKTIMKYQTQNIN